MSGPELEARPTSLRDAGRRVWLETLNLVAEYGTLVVFAGLAAAAEAARRSSELPPAADLGMIVAEAVSAVTMIVPKAIRSIGDVFETAAITMHDVWYAVRYGERRPEPEVES